MKPLVKYRGGKSKEIPHLIKHIPQYSGRYIEPFLGGRALFFHFEPKRAIINDIKSKLIAFYLGVKDNFETLKTELNFRQPHKRHIRFCPTHKPTPSQH